MTFQDIETEDFTAWLPRPIARKPRVFVVQPQRLFVEAMRQLLGVDFEITGISESLHDIARTESLDLILIDADVVRPSEEFLVDLAQQLDALVCLLSLTAPTTLKNEQGCRIRVVSKSLTPQQFVETLSHLITTSDTF